MRYLLFTVAALQLAGCTQWAGALKGGETSTVVSLSQRNYRVVMTGARGESVGFTFLFFPLIAPSEGQAKDQLYRSVGQPLEGRAFALANQTEDHSLFTLILFSLPKVTLTADVVEFIDPNAVALNESYTPAPVVISPDAEFRKAEAEFRAGRMSLTEFRDVRRSLYPQWQH